MLIKFPRANQIPNVLFFSDQQCKTPKYSNYDDIKYKKAGHLHVLEAENRNLFDILSRKIT